MLVVVGVGVVVVAAAGVHYLSSMRVRTTDVAGTIPVANPAPL
jgi:hypothetical protein